MRIVAASFGVSDVWLKKMCAGASVPVPERRDWAKLQAGKAVSRIRLPQRDPGMPDEVSIGREPYSWRWGPEAELAKPLPDPPVFDEPINDVHAQVVKRVGKVAQIRDLDSPWGAIRKLLTKDDQRRTKQAGQTWSSSFYAPRFDSPFERRRLRMLNSLAIAFARSGAKLERQLTDIVISFVVAGEAQYRSNQISHHAWLIDRRAENEAEVARRRAEAERKRREQQLKEERERREFLFDQARDWRAAQDIRAFVGNVRLQSGGADGADGSQLASSSAWAFAEADAIDPVKRGLQPWCKADDHEAEEEDEEDDEY